MRLFTLSIAVTAACGLLIAAERVDAQKRKTPYWASIAAGKARMRTGPGRNYPASWLYQRPGLPVRVIDVYKEWRKVEDPGGTQGWMQGNLLTNTRMGFVTDSVIVMHEQRNAASRTAWRAAPGVVGRISQCSDGWCRFDVHGRAGEVEASGLFGVDPGEEIE